MKDTATTTALGIGIFVGALLGIAFDNLALWLSLGIAIGLAVGTAFERRGKD